MIIYSKATLKSWMAGRQIMFLAIVDPKYRGDLAVTEHEREHIAQWWMVTGLTAVAMAFGAYVANTHMGVTWVEMVPLLAVPPSMHGLLYMMLRPYRLWAEVQAHRVSVLHRPDRLDQYANHLATKYKLKITTAKARELLS